MRIKDSIQEGLQTLTMTAFGQWKNAQKRSNGGKLHGPKRQYKVTNDTFNGMTSFTFLTMALSLSRIYTQ